MNWLRRGSVFFLSVILFGSLVGLAVTANVSRPLRHPEKLKAWISESKVYDSFVAAALQSSQKTGEANGTAASVSLTNPQVEQAAKQAFSTSVLQASVNNFIDANYNWLSGKTKTPEFNIDLTAPKNQFADNVGQQVEKRLAGLPACSPEQLAQLQLPADPLSVNCRPSLLDPKTEGTRIAQEIKDSNYVLNNAVVTPDNLNQTVSNEQGQPYYRQLSGAPKLYKFLTRAPWILGVIALLSALTLVAISSTRRRGLRRAGIMVALSGLTLIAIKLVADNLTGRLANQAKANLTVQFKQPASDLIHRAEPRFVAGYLWYGIAFLAIALAIFIALYATRNRAPRVPRNRSTPEEAAEEPSLEAEEISTRLAPRRKPPVTPPVKPKADQPQGPPPLGKTPPKRKPPRLIQ